MVDKKVSDEKLKEMSGGSTDDLQENQPNPGENEKADLTKGNRPT